MAVPRRYPDEVRDRAVRLVWNLVDNGEDSMTVVGACRRVGEQLGINTDTLRNWIKPALVDDGERSGLTTSDRARLVELERERLKGDAPDIWPEGLDHLPPSSTDPSQDVSGPEGHRPMRGVIASHQAKHYVGGPQGRQPTKEEALEMGRALSDAINAERHAAQNDHGVGQPGDEPSGATSSGHLRSVLPLP